MGRVLDAESLQTEIKNIRRRKKIVFTNGCFDILHVGHVRYLREAAALGDYLVVGLNSDASVKRLKGPTRPVQAEGDRAEILAALEFVSFVCLFEEDTPIKLIEAFKPDVLVKGGDWPLDRIIGAKEVLASGGQVRALKFHPGHSTSAILATIHKL